MGLKVAYMSDDAIERDAEALLADYARERGVPIEAPIPIEDIIEKHLKIGVEFDDTHRLFGVPRSGIGFDPERLKDEWLAYVREVLNEATLKVPAAGGWAPKGGKQGLHSEHLSKLLAEMQILQRSHPGASW